MIKYILLPLLLGLSSAGSVSGQSAGSAAAKVRHIITSDGVDLYVTVKGSGTPCLYIHGGPGSGSWWLEKFSGAMLEKRFRMIYLDQRGTCRSSSPKDGNFSMDRMIQDFEEVRNALGIGQWITLGHSFGGILQVGYARRHPEIMKGMIMLNCSLSFEASAAEAIPKICEFLNISDTGAYTDTTVPVMDRLMPLVTQLRERDIFWKMHYASPKKKKIMDATFEEIPNWNKDLENSPLAGQGYGEDYRKETSGLTMPVLFFYGKKDWMVGPEHYKGVHFPNMMPWGSDVGHVASLENPADLKKAIDSYRKKYTL